MELLLHTIFPITLYTLGAILLIVLIILGIKLIQSIDKANRLLDDIQEKISSLDTLFHIVDGMSNTLSRVTETFVGNIVQFASRIFHRKKEEEEDYE